MRKIMVAANWKMHMKAGETERFFKEFLPLLKDGQVKAALTRSTLEIVLFPPFTSLYVASFAMEEAPKGVALGAQNVHWESHGAFTGEIAPAMVAESGCRYCLVGHSERRHLFGETSEETELKIKALLDVSVRPVLCVGETLEERERGQTFSVIERQLRAGLKNLTKEVLSQEIVLAYEPVWAIGTGKTASEDDAQEVCSHLRDLLSALWDKKAAEAVRILYGGSVKPDNAGSLLAMDDIDGLLVGGASLKSDSFFQIVGAGCR